MQASTGKKKRGSATLTDGATLLVQGNPPHGKARGTTLAGKLASGIPGNDRSRW